MNLRPSVILAMFLSLATSFAVFISGCSWGTDDTSAPPTAISPVATRTPASTPSPVDMVSPTHASVDTLTPTSTLASTTQPGTAPTPLADSNDTSANTIIVRPPDSHCGRSWYGAPAWYPDYRPRFLQWTMDGSTIFFDALFKFPNLRAYSDKREKKLFAVNARGSHMEEIMDLSYQLFPPTDDWYSRFYDSVHLGSDGYFDISPDMSRIVYSTCRYRIQPEHSGARRTWGYPEYDRLMHSYEIAVSSMDGVDIRRLTDDGDADYNYPSWSPDGQRIAFLAARSTYYQFLRRNAPGPLPDPYDKLITMTADGSDLREVASRLTIAPYPPVWSPDGQRVAFLVEEGTEEEPGEDSPPQRAIYVVGSDGSNLTRVSSAISPPSWSPDSRLLAFARRHGDGTGIFTIGPDGSYPWMVTDITEDLESSKDLAYKFDGNLPLRDHWVDRVLWSPDGERIAFTCATVCVVNKDGSSLVRSPVQPHGWSIPDWSPDGSRVAVLNAGDTLQIPRIVLYTMSLDGTDIQSLVQGNWSLVAENSGWEDVDANIESCAGGYVVPEPKKNPGLVLDCTTLLTIRDSLVGEVVYSPDFLIPRLNNWNRGTPIDQWLGVTVGGSPRRVVALELPGYLGGVGRYSVKRQLFGVIPPELGRLTGLRTLNLAYNRLTGVIPPELGRLWKLENLHLQRNTFGGSIPSELGGLVNLRKMEIGSNRLTGGIPPELGNLSSLEELGLVENRLTGGIPPELGNLVNLKELILTGGVLYGDQFTGPIPAELGNMTSLKVLNLVGNQLTGSIPPELGSLRSLEELNLARNQLTGSIPPELGSLGSLEELNLARNQLTGSIPPELGNLSNLWVLNLFFSGLTGQIPPELGNMTNLSALYLEGNGLTGQIPPELGNMTNLSALYLEGNGLTGQISSELGNLKNLHTVSLQGNNLNGCVPVELPDIWVRASGLERCPR